ncbi:hypothetical protein NL676_012175 [Syzygium grande]|nr:hypothetical protein NL676_012175 [Syzygium grande]
MGFWRRAFMGNEVPAQKSNCDLSLVMFNSHGNLSGVFFRTLRRTNGTGMVQQSAWTKDVSRFLDWLSAMSFGGGGFNDAAIAEGLSEALMMFAIPPNGNLPPQSLDGKRHCVLVAATNPYPLSTPVYRPTFQLEDEHMLKLTLEDLYVMLRVLRNFSLSAVFLSQLFAQSSFQNFGQSTMLENAICVQQILRLIM